MIELKPIDRSKEITKVIVDGLNKDFVAAMNAMSHDSITEAAVEKAARAIKDKKLMRFPLVYQAGSRFQEIYQVTIDFTTENKDVKVTLIDNNPILIGFKKFDILEKNEA